MFWPILLIAVSGVITLLGYLLDYHFHDKRKKSFIWTRNGLYAANVISLALSIGAVCVEQRDHIKEIEQEDKRYADLLASSRRERAEHTRQHGEDMAALRNLQAELEAIQKEIGPIITTLKKKYPKASEAELLSHAQEELASLDARTSKIENELAPRTVPTSAGAAFAKALEGGRECRVNFEAMMGDGESMGFANDLGKYFLAAGWKATGITQVSDTALRLGVFVEASAHVPRKCVVAAVGALRAAGVRPEVKLTNNSDGLQILIGNRKR